MDKQVFDIIIVGAGTAGCLLANRLSANKNLNIALIEAGGSCLLYTSDAADDP